MQVRQLTVEILLSSGSKMSPWAYIVIALLNELLLSKLVAQLIIFELLLPIASQAVWNTGS